MTTTPNDAVGGRKMEETSGAESARKGPTAFLTATQHSAGDVCSIYRLRFLGKRQKARLLAYPRVLIRSDNGFWRANRCGYTSFEGAAVYEGADAYAATYHCGPEKEVAYYLLRPAENGDAVARSASAGNEGEAEVLRDAIPNPQHLEARIRELEGLADRLSSLASVDRNRHFTLAMVSVYDYPPDGVSYRDRLSADLNAAAALIRSLRELQAQVEGCRGALEFYRDAWLDCSAEMVRPVPTADGVRGEPFMQHWRIPMDTLRDDKGDRARQALAALHKEA